MVSLQCFSGFFPVCVCAKIKDRDVPPKIQLFRPSSKIGIPAFLASGRTTVFRGAANNEKLKKKMFAKNKVFYSFRPICLNIINYCKSAAFQRNFINKFAIRPLFRPCIQNYYL